MGLLLPSGRRQIVISYLCPLNIYFAFLINVLLHKHCWCNCERFLKLIPCCQGFGMNLSIIIDPSQQMSVDGSLKRTILQLWCEPLSSYSNGDCSFTITVKRQWSVSSNKSICYDAGCCILHWHLNIYLIT